MASEKQFADFVLYQLGDVGEVSAKKMFGEYGLYAGEKLFGVICDNRLFIKPTLAGRNFIGAVKEEPPYKGAKPYFLIEEQIQDQKWLCELVLLTASELPLPKPKKKKQV
jgi:TfoX/Sxy family transcriptional regulator of competence genes